MPLAFIQPDDSPLGLACDRIDEDLAQVAAGAGKARILQQLVQRRRLLRLPARRGLGIAGERGAEGGADLQQFFLGGGAAQQRVGLQRGRPDQADDRDQHDQPDISKACRALNPELQPEPAWTPPRYHSEYGLPLRPLPSAPLWMS
jgi:hypothetical protein